MKRILNLLNEHKDVRKLELEMRPARPEDEEALILRTRIVQKNLPEDEDETGRSQEDRRVLRDGQRASGGRFGRTGEDNKGEGHPHRHKFSLVPNRVEE